jgi:hypothetical protein
LPDAAVARYTVYLYSHFRARTGVNYGSGWDNRLLCTVHSQPPETHARDA